MKKISKLALVISTTLCVGTALASFPNTDNNPTTFVGPSLRASYTAPLTETTAYSVLGAAGFKNFRVGATVGWGIDSFQRMKVSAEYLWEDVKYSFASGNEYQWVRQGAIGAAYQYDFSDYRWNPQFNLSAYASYAPSKTLNPVFGTFINSQGFVQLFSDYRRVAGSTGLGIAPGVSFHPWWGARAELDLNYDNVQYDTIGDVDRDATGFGGTLSLNQLLTDTINIDLLASVRQPFNNYGAQLNFSQLPYLGSWSLGVFGEYTAGKESLYNTWDAGIALNFVAPEAPMPINMKGDFKGIYRNPVHDPLLAYTSQPAVYMPQVLAIADGSTSRSCNSGGAPVFTGSISDFSDSTGSINLGYWFSGNNLTYVVDTFPALAPGDTVTLVNGRLDWNLSHAYTIFVTAENSCGCAYANEFDLGEDDT